MSLGAASHNGPVVQAALALSTTAIKILADRASEFPSGTGRKGVWLENQSATIAIRLGDSSANLTTSNGVPRLAPGAQIFLEWQMGDTWWAIAESGTPNLGRTVVV